MTDTTRERNRRGEGAKLRTEILTAATRLLESSGSEEAVTLRAVARGVGIAPPSIYAHFPDREAIVDAVVDEAFRDFSAALARALDPADDPVTQLRRGCAAYLDFAERHPNRYRLLFERRDLIGRGPERPVDPVRKGSFGYLADAVRRCVDAGRSTSTDASGDACAIWVALHGYATLRQNLPSFPWPERKAMLDRIVSGLAHVTDAG
jgi:AcrR family transcriptional regulator